MEGEWETRAPPTSAAPTTRFVRLGFQMSELQRREEQLELRAEELRKTQDATLRMPDALEHMAEVRRAGLGKNYASF